MVELRRTRAELERGMALRWHTGAQLYASLRGETVADLATGEARPGVPLTRTTVVEWASATKPVTCSAAALLWQQGRFDLDDPVWRHLPEFAAAGKEAVTVRHLLTHTAGLTEPQPSWGSTWEDYAAAVCRAPLMEGWVPGRRCAYNSVAMWAVAALVVRLSGRPFGAFVRETLLEPLGLTDSWLAMPVAVYRAYAGAGRVAAIPGYERSGTEAWVTWGRPTGGGHGPIRDLGRFYAAVLRRQPPFPLTPPVIEAMTTRHLCGVYDERLHATVDRGLGFQLGSSNPAHGYGRHASRRTFGHGGGSWTQAFADAENGLAAALYVNGRLGPHIQAEHFPTILSALYEDLRLA
ncbi:MAG TPA: serine hydrolase domain-containing protein [Chloroflexota bacterium]|nr:serine hydrolase domain-containing protein [Chloroflexota bacterium]